MTWLNNSIEHERILSLFAATHVHVESVCAILYSGHKAVVFRKDWYQSNEVNVSSHFEFVSERMENYGY